MRTIGRYFLAAGVAWFLVFALLGCSLPSTSQSDIRSEPSSPSFSFQRNAFGQDFSMPSKGQVKCPLVIVSFSTSRDGGSGDSASQWDGVLNGDDSPDGFPYESVRAYYDRASYGSLSLSFEVLEYQAKTTPAYYSQDPSLLAEEVFEWLSENGDASAYDADADGVLDCLYLRPRVEVSDWNSPWWSHTGFSKRSAGGVALGSYVMLHRSAVQAGSAISAIHETGHALGLPDLYTTTAVDDVDGNGQPTGSGAYGMMSSQAGDIEAYFKWSLGWFSPDDVVEMNNADTLPASFDIAPVADSSGVRMLWLGEAGTAGYAIWLDAPEGNGRIAFDETGTLVPEHISVFKVDPTRYPVLSFIDGDRGQVHKVYHGVPSNEDGTYRCGLYAGDVLEVELGGSKATLHVKTLDSGWASVELKRL